MANVLFAFLNLIKNPITDITEHYKSLNRANNMGDALEFYVKDLFCDSLNIKDINAKQEIYSRHFSYIGNQNNPPDIIIKGGDAIEVKKIENLNSSIALNSSYPKDKLYSDSPMLTKACCNCESWQEKDLIYIVGTVKNKKLGSLWLIYGDCYAANKDCYEKMKNAISSKINDSTEICLSQTKELGRVNKVDPLGITYLRIRGMWGIDNPVKVFNYITGAKTGKSFTANLLMLKQKYITFPNRDKEQLENSLSTGLTINDVKIKSPNNPAKLLDAKLLTFMA